MESLTTLHHRSHHPINISLNLRRPFFSYPISQISFNSKPSSLKFRTIISSQSPQNPISQIPKTPISISQIPKTPFSNSFLKTTSIVAVTVAALFLSRFGEKTAIAAPILPTTTVEKTEEEKFEKTLEENLISNPNDVDTLRSLMEAKVKNRKPAEAIEILNRLIEIEPNDPEWPLLKSHLYSYSGDSEMAKVGFEQVLEKDPLRVEAFHGLVMTVSQSESGGENELQKVLKRIESALEKCKNEKKKESVRDFKLLIAQIKVIEGNYDSALKVYEELVKEEPRDFRPYLCQGIIYTLLKKKDEAEKQFQNYRRLVPKEHPYAQYFDDNMIATKVFSQKVENERDASRI